MTNSTLEACQKHAWLTSWTPGDETQSCTIESRERFCNHLKMALLYIFRIHTPLFQTYWEDNGKILSSLKSIQNSHWLHWYSPNMHLESSLNHLGIWEAPEPFFFSLCQKWYHLSPQQIKCFQSPHSQSSPTGWFMKQHKILALNRKRLLSSTERKREGKKRGRYYRLYAPCGRHCAFLSV